MPAAKLTFYPVGNGDTSLVRLADGRLILVDYCDQRNADDRTDKRIDLPAELRKRLDTEGRDEFDVVAFTHADRDHLARADQFFWFEHAKKFQDDQRVKMRTLWVPAALVLEESLSGPARVVRQEARHRLREGKGIRVFSAPGALDDWLRGEGIDPVDRKDLITHAGSLVPGFGQSNGSAEFFVHSPFSFRFDDDPSDRNNGSLVLHLTLFSGPSTSRVFLGADGEYQAWVDAVLKTESKGRKDRLRWDLFAIAHHCSYTALAAEKGENKTEPVEEVKRLFEEYGCDGGIIVSSSNEIDSPNTPPHSQAANYYKGVVGADNFLVTMEHPTKANPKPIHVLVTDRGLKVEAAASLGALFAVTSKPSPRFGQA